MADMNDHREPLGEVDYPPEVKKALDSVTEMPSDLQEQAEFFDKIQESLSSRLRDDS